LGKEKKTIGIFDLNGKEGGGNLTVRDRKRQERGRRTGEREVFNAKKGREKGPGKRRLVFWGTKRSDSQKKSDVQWPHFELWRRFVWWRWERGETKRRGERTATRPKKKKKKKKLGGG